MSDAYSFGGEAAPLGLDYGPQTAPDTSAPTTDAQGTPQTAAPTQGQGLGGLFGLFGGGGLGAAPAAAGTASVAFV